MGDAPEIKIENHGVTLTEKPDETTKHSSNDAVGVNLDRDLLESLVNLEHELTGLDTRKALAEGSRLCDEITMETNKITKLVDAFLTEAKPPTEEVQQVITGFTNKVNDLVKYHHDNKLTNKAEVDLLKTGLEKITSAVTSAEADPGQVEEAQRILQIFIKNIDQIDGAYKSVRRRMSTTPTSPHVASPPRLNLSGHARQESDSTTSSNQNTERSAGQSSVPTTPTAKADGGMKHASTTPDFKKKKSYSVSSKKSKSKLTDNEIQANEGEENKEEKKKRTHSRRTTLSLALPARKENEQKDEEKQKEKAKEKDKKDKKSKTPREDGEKKKKFSIKDSWKRLTSAFVPSSKEDKRHTMAAAGAGDTIDWDAPSPRKEKKEKEKQEKEAEKEREKQEKEREKEEKEKEKEREKQEKQDKENGSKSPRKLRLSLSMRKKSKSKREDSTMIKSSPASTARGEGSMTDRTETSTSQNPTPRTAREASASEEKGPGSNGKAAINNSLKELPKQTSEVKTPKPTEEKVPDTPKLAISPAPTPTAQTPAQGNTPRGNSPRAVLVREISKKMLVARRAPSQQQLRQIKTKLSQMKLAWDEYTTGGLTTMDVSEIDEHALDADIKELENLEGFDVDDIVNFEPDGPALDDANMTDELNALDNMLDEFDDEFDTPSMREPSSSSKVVGGTTSYLSAYD